MRKLLILMFIAPLAACSSSDDGIVAPPLGECSNTAQKQFVLDSMRDWYLWNDRLPAQVDLEGFDSPEELLAFLTTFSPNGSSGEPIDAERGFSFISLAEDEQQLFGEGRFEGYGFNSRFVAANDLRLARVFEDSPAFRGGLRRGQRILELNDRTIADIEAQEGVGAVFDTTPIRFRMLETDGTTEFTVTIEQDIVTIDPVPNNWRVIDAAGGRKVGYMALASFISTADAQMDQVFAEFRNQNVNDVILDLRYNGGGLVRTAELLGDLLGGFDNDGRVFSETLFNADRAAANNDIEFFELRGSSISLVNLVVIASSNTASASELVANSMDPWVGVGTGVSIVGDTTFGKPVGQIGLEFCEKILRPTAFQTVNAAGFGDYFDGLTLDCAAADDLNVATGDDADPNIVAALSILDGTGCPTVAATAAELAAQKAAAPAVKLRGPPHREFANAY